MANVKKLTRILDKLVQVGPFYLDQTLRSYVTENKEYRLYFDKDDQNDPTATTYAAFSYFSSGIYKTEEVRKTDILIVAGGGGGSAGNISGGSGGGEVIVVEGAELPAGSYVIEVGAGGAGGNPTNYMNLPISGTGVNTGLGANGNPTVFRKIESGSPRLQATGGGVGGFRKSDNQGTPGGSGGGAGGADYSNQGTGSSLNQGSITTSHADLAGIIATDFYGGTVTKYGNVGGDSDAFVLATLANADDYYNSGGGGGAGGVGQNGNDDRAGNGGDGISIPWVNEVFQKIYKFNGDVYWGAGGGGAAGADNEPGNGGLGGGGGGAAYRQLGTGSPESQIYWNGLGGKQGYNNGYDSAYLVGGAGGQNTGSGAGGCIAVDQSVGTHIHRPIEFGPNGGSGFVLVRVSMTDTV